MAQNFYTKWQNAILADAGGYVSKEYRSFQTALVREISKYATAVGAQVASNLKGHYDTSCFIERNGKFVYISHSSTLARMGGGVRVELDSFLIRTAQHAKDYRGGYNQYCDMANLQSMMDDLLKEYKTENKKRCGAYRFRIFFFPSLPAHTDAVFSLL